jgi:hypothetical protein
MNDYVKTLENGDICLTGHELINQPMPNGLKASHAVLSRMGVTVHWFTEFLAGTGNGHDELQAAERTYKAHRDASGTVFLYEIRGRQGNGVGFTPAEIPLVLDALRKMPGDVKETQDNPQ